LESASLDKADGGLQPPLSPATSSTASAPPTSLGPRATFGVSSLCNVGKSSQNQDSYVASANSSGSKCLVGVFDGHGENGKQISEYAKTQIAKCLFNNKELHTNPGVALESAFFDAQHQIERKLSAEAHHSGTTAVAAYQHRDKLYIANAGDSRAVLGQLTGASSGGMKAIELSSDQRPGRPDERRRILSAGGVVQQSQYPMRTHGGPPRLMRVGPERVWDRTGCCGLGVTRSLGDLAMHPFVVADPEIAERRIEAKDKLLILGSDGVWDRLQSQEAVDIAARHVDPTAAAREITEIARRRWHQETQGHVSDDITAVVVRLDHSGDGGGDPLLPPPSAPAAMNSTMNSTFMKSRRGTAPADSDRRDREDALMPLNRLAASLGSDAMRSSSRPRRSRKAPVHNWKGPKESEFPPSRDSQRGKSQQGRGSF
jgi:serine/threonine protein phosphatase PrpC